MNLHYSDVGLLLICSLRYALGRSSYVTSAIAEIVEKNWLGLSVSDKEVILRDIREALAEAEKAGRKLGMDMDDRMWRALVERLGQGVES